MRIRLQVIFVSDLISDSSLVVKESILSDRGSSKKYNNYNWPESQPSKVDQSIWRKFIILITNPRRTLIQLKRLSIEEIQIIKEEQYSTRVQLFKLLYHK